jgi:hypothetical protein
MNENQKAALLMARAAVLNAKIAGMVAENDFLKQRDMSIAYDEAAFCKVVDESGCTENAALTLLG